MVSDISPNRALSQPAPNRVLNFGRQNVRADTGSPFKPTKVLRRSFGGARKAQSVSSSPPGSDSKPELPTMDAETIQEEDAKGTGEDETAAGAEPSSDESHAEAQQYLEIAEDAPPMFNDEDDYYDTQGDANEADITSALEHAEVLLQTTPTVTPTIKRSRGRPRKSQDATETSIVQQTSANSNASSNSRKRNRAEIEDDQDDKADESLQSIGQTENDTTQASATSEKPAKRSRGRPRKNQVTVLQDPTEQTVLDADQTVPDADETLHSIEEGDNEPSQITTASAPEEPAKRGRGRPRKSDVTIVHDNTEQNIDPTLLALGDSYLAPINEDDEVEIAPASPEPQAKTKPSKKPKAQKATKSQKAPKERDPNQSMRRTPSASPGKVDRDRALILSPSKRAGSVSNVNLRASTPFEDAHQRMSRSGRPIMAPLKHWAGESYVWKNGEVEGIIRADEVKTPGGNKKKGSKSKRRVPRANGRGGGHDLDAIAEESDTESTVPDDWEEQVGVIAGTVAAWDPDAQEGDPRNPIREGTSRLQLYGASVTNFYRHCIFVIVHCDPRRGWIGFPVCQDHDAALLRLRHCRAAARRLQEGEELSKNANGLLCARRQSSGDSGPEGRRSERRSYHQQRDERVRDLQRWCVGGPKRYVLEIFLSLHIPSSQPSRSCSKSHTSPPSREHGTDRTLGRRAVSEVCHLIF
jgi:hypothetical protein